MKQVTFITGNQVKADFLAKFLGVTIKHKKLDLDEIQSVNLEEVAERKARQAYKILGSPVLVEDVGLVFKSLGKLPGPFIKWFELELGLERICRLVDGLDSRDAVGEVVFCYFDGQKSVLFHGKIEGLISDRPRGSKYFGWDPIFIPSGADKTLAQMNEAETEKYSLRTTTVYPQIKKFLENLSS